MDANEITCSFFFSLHFHAQHTETITKGCDQLSTIRYCLLIFKFFQDFKFREYFCQPHFLHQWLKRIFFWKLFCFDISNTSSKNKENLGQSVLDFAWFLLALKACISAIFYQIFIPHQMVAFQKLWKIIFISSKKLFSFLRSSNFCISTFPSFSPCQSLL